MVENGEEAGYDRWKRREWEWVGNELISECLTREEVGQALGSLQKRSAPGSDGLTAEMVCCNVLVNLWCSLFNWCRRSGMIPSEWRIEECNSSYTEEEESGCVQDR